MRLDAAERVAELYFRMGDLERAGDYARGILEIDAYLPGANYIYGCVRKAQGDFVDARDGFRWALRSPEYRSSAYQQLAEMDLMEKDMKGAVQNASLSLDFNKLNLNSHKIMDMANSLLGERALAQEALEGLLDVDPLSHFALFEAYLLRPAPETLDAFNQSFRNEMAREEYLETALFYQGLALHEEALKVLEEAPDYPVIDYWLAWLNRDDDEKSESYLEKAVNASPAYVFPFRNSTLPVLRWASERKASWITDYYAALILWSRGKDQEALDLLEQWEDTPDFIPFYYSRAHLSGIDSEQAQEDMQRALELDPDQWRIYRDLAEIYFRKGDNKAALELAGLGHERFPGNYILELAYSKYLTVAGEYQSSLDILEKTNVLPFEGENTGQRLHVYNHLLLAYEQFKSGEYTEALTHIDQSEQYPENLGSGAPYAPDYRDQNRLRMMIYERTGQRELYRSAEEAIRDYDQRHGERRGRSIFDQQFSTMVVQPF